MPSGLEIHYGYPSPEKAWDFVSRRSDLEMVNYDDGGDPLSLEDFLAGKIEDGRPEPTESPAFDALVEQAFYNTLGALGWSYVKVKNKYNPSKYDLVVDSPWGKRDARPWHCYVIYDPSEMGEDPQHLSLGINLSSRYFPGILDMKSTHGTIYENIVFDTNNDLWKRAEVCKQEIIKLIPEMHDGEFYIREIWY